ncbi:MAG TPA: hypothetical protein VE569_08125 [Acidimicrobiia bacterium]|nr:hypothetical protein [Acidimicrobiia bacterium]
MARYIGPDGREHSKAFDRKVDAEHWLREHESRIDRGLWLDPAAGRVTLEEYASAWIAGKIVKPKTMEGYKSLLWSRILPEFGSVELRQITRDSVRSWVAQMTNDGLSASRVKQVRALLAQTLGQAEDDGVLGRNPAARVATPRKTPRRQKFLTPDQVEGLAMACASRQPGAGSIVRFLAWTGLR